MKLKQLPEDFKVSEVFHFERANDGPHFVHVLRKQKVDTATALSTIARHAQVGREDIAFAGLKDRQAETEQWISIRGRRCDWDGEGISVRFVGRSRTPVTSKASLGNRFAIVVRDLLPTEVVAARRQLASLLRCGCPNYFDDQRFGCLRHGQGFVLRAVLAGRYEEALHRMIARPSRFAITGDVKLKQALARHWGDWATCRRVARGPWYQRLFEHLQRRPDDFRGALPLLPERMRLIHAFAYQSYLWNRAVTGLLLRLLPRREQLWLSNASGRVLAWRYLTPELQAELEGLRTPLYGPHGERGTPSFAALAQSVLRDEGFDEAAFDEHRVPGMALRGEPRALIVRPQELTVGNPAEDERNEGRLKLSLTFALPRGAYATLLLKRLFVAPPRRGGAPRDVSRSRSKRSAPPR
jgi:tRNA pseudouridine13 synthase